MASPSLCLVFPPLLLSLGFCLWPITLSCALSCSHSQATKNLHIFSVFKGMLMKALLSSEYTPRKMSRARCEVFNTMRGSSSVPFALGIGKDEIQRENCGLHGNVSPSSATASRACASCGGEGREVCSHPSARVSPSMAPSWKSCRSRGTWHPTSLRGTAGSGTAPSFPSSTAFTGSMAQ